MHVFLTGATGFIGSRVLKQLIAAGHGVTGTARSDAGAQQVEAAGARVHRSTLDDPAGLAAGAEAADAVIHTAFDHNFTTFVENTRKDYRVIHALGEVLRGSDRALLITSGTGMGTRTPGEPATEDWTDWENPNPRIASERAGQELIDAGVSVAAVRLPQVHNTRKAGLISPLIEIARANGFAAYLDEGRARWPAAHVDDVALLYRLALKKHRTGAHWNAVAEDGVPARAIAEAIGKGLGIPVRSIGADEAPAYFGWMAMFAGLDMPASSAWTRETLDWIPNGPGLLQDLASMDFGALAR